MKIVIEYDSSWMTSFLEGADPNNILKSRKFVATTKTKGETRTPVTDSTVLGVLSRLIGDQRKLHQSRRSKNYYFSDIEDKVSWRITKEQTVDELIYLTNKSEDRCGQGTWLGVLPDDCPWFFSEHAPLLWSVLYLERDELLSFILMNKAHRPTNIKEMACYPRALLARLDDISNKDTKTGEPWLTAEQLEIERSKVERNLEAEQEKRAKHIEKFANKPPKTDKQIKAYENKLIDLDKKIDDLIFELNNFPDKAEYVMFEEKLNSVVNFIRTELDNQDKEYWSKGRLYPMSLYAASLYLQAERLIQEDFDFDFVLKEGKVAIKGFSKQGFNGVRDWLNNLAGGRKKAVGTPCLVQKQSGQLEVNLDLDLHKAIELKTMIDKAGVSAFYLGKKGLAYVSRIDVR